MCRFIHPLDSFKWLPKVHQSGVQWSQDSASVSKRRTRENPAKLSSITLLVKAEGLKSEYSWWSLATNEKPRYILVFQKGSSSFPGALSDTSRRRRLRRRLNNESQFKGFCASSWNFGCAQLSGCHGLKTIGTISLHGVRYIDAIPNHGSSQFAYDMALQLREISLQISKLCSRVCPCQLFGTKTLWPRDLAEDSAPSTACCRVVEVESWHVTCDWKNISHRQWIWGDMFIKSWSRIYVVCLWLWHDDPISPKREITTLEISLWGMKPKTFPAHLLLPGSVGKAAKRFAANVGEGAMG